MSKARKQNGSLYLDVNGSKTPIWKFSWWHVLPNGKHVRRRRRVGTLDQYKTKLGFVGYNPISGPNGGAGVRQSSKRQSIPDILEVSEMQAILAEVQLRERVLLFLDMVTGFRRGELTGLKSIS
jgi:integrase